MGLFNRRRAGDGALVDISLNQTSFLPLLPPAPASLHFTLSFNAAFLLPKHNSSSTLPRAYLPRALYAYHTPASYLPITLPNVYYRFYLPAHLRRHHRCRVSAILYFAATATLRAACYAAAYHHWLPHYLSFSSPAAHRLPPLLPKPAARHKQYPTPTRAYSIPSWVRTRQRGRGGGRTGQRMTSGAGIWTVDGDWQAGGTGRNQSGTARRRVRTRDHLGGCSVTAVVSVSSGDRIYNCAVEQGP